MVSVILPTYNRPAMTMRAVKSVLAQTYRDIEIMVVDDCSGEPITLAQLPGDPRIKVIRHEVNLGVSAARNTGVRNARGEVIAFLDSDDYWVPEKLEDQLAVYNAQPDKENVFLYSSYFYEKDGKWVIMPFAPLGKGEAVSDYVFLGLGDIHASTWLASRALFEKHPFPEQLSRHEDWEVLLRMEADQVRFVYSAKPSGVRAADLRADRLSSVVLLPMMKFFLKRNAERLTPKAQAMLAASVAAREDSGGSGLRKQMRQLIYFARCPRLTVGQKAGLLVNGIRIRLLFRWNTWRRQQAPGSAGFAPVDAQ